MDQGGVDLWQACKHGEEDFVALTLRAQGSKAKELLNRPGSCDSYPLHVAVWRNHAGIVSRLLAAGAIPDLQDGESGWTCLHKAVYWGHLRVASLLIKAGASLDITDHKGRTPLDLLSAELKPYQPTAGMQASAHRHGAALTSGLTKQHATTVHCWGSGANYQLGTGSTDFAASPVRVEQLCELGPVSLSAAKYHSAAVATDGKLWTWGWGRGGRLGHPDFNIHSGEAALLRPWQVAGLGKRWVVSLAAGKHHTLVATSAGEVWSFGNGKGGKLGYGEVDTQPTPRRLAALQRVRVVAVAASHKHSAALTSGGEVFTWGCNADGQLGYGTSDSACNPTPRLVDALKGKVLVAVSLAKRHSVVLTEEGEPYTWGHQLVTPRRVNLAGARDIARAAAPSTPDTRDTRAGSSSVAAAKADANGSAAGVSSSTRDIGQGPGAGSSQSWTGSEPVVRFHKGHSEVVRPVAVSVAAGFTHTTCVTRCGCVLAWWSADPALKVQEVQGVIAGVRITSVSASKTRTAVLSDTGDVYMWEAKTSYAQGRSGADAAAGAQASSNTLAASDYHLRSGPSFTSDTHPSAASSFTDSATRSDGMSSSFRDGVQGSSLGASGGMALAGIALKKRTQKGTTRETRDQAFSQPIVPVKVPGVKRVVQVAVGEKHTLALSAWSVPPMPNEHGVLTEAVLTAVSRSKGGTGSTGDASDTELDEMIQDSYDASAAHTPLQAPALHHLDTRHSLNTRLKSTPGAGPYLLDDASGADQAASQHQAGSCAVPSLQRIAQEVVAEQLVDPRSALPIMEYADAAGAQLLRTFCLAVVLRNLDLVLLDSSPALLALAPHLVVELEQHYKAWLQPGRVTHTAHPSSHAGAAAGRDVGATPPLGSSPVSGSWVESYAGRHGQIPGVRRQQLCKLQPARRPTSVPPGIDGSINSQGLSHTAANHLLEHASHAALAAIGHAAHVPSHELGLAGSRAGSASMSRPDVRDAAFQPNGQEGQVQEEAAAARLARNIHKKLQQIAALESKAAAAAAGAPGTAPLDAQQLAKLSQKGLLTEALHALESGTPVRVVERLLNPTRRDADKAGQTDAAPPVPVRPGSGSGQLTDTSKQQHTSPAKADQGSRRGRDSSSTPAGGTSSATPAAAAAPVSPARAGSSTSEPGATASTSTAAAASAAGGVVKAVKDKPLKRKGGLSMFLSGALEVPSPVTRVATPPAATPPKGPAWGGAVLTPQSAGPSLKELLSAASQAGSSTPDMGPAPWTPGADGGAGTKGPIAASVAASPAANKPSQAPELHRKATSTQPAANTSGHFKPARVPSAASLATVAAADVMPTPPTAAGPGPRLQQSTLTAAGGTRLSLAEFMAVGSKPASAPVVVPPRDSGAAAGLPAWGGTGVLGGSPIASSSLLNAPPKSLKQIQEEQARQKASAPTWVASAEPNRPGPSTATASASRPVPVQSATPSHAVYGSSPQSSKWYVPEPQRPQALPAIQTEEVAMQQLSMLYGTHVKISRTSGR